MMTMFNSCKRGMNIVETVEKVFIVCRNIVGLAI